VITFNAGASGPVAPGLDVDRDVPALVLKIGQYPVHSGGLAVIRTLGRLGVPVYAITEPHLTPASVSRYCTGRFVWHATGRERPEDLIADLVAVGRRIGRKSVVIPVDDEAAVLVAEYAAELSDYFLLPQVAPHLPARLASKTGLFGLCREHGIPAPASVTPASLAEVAAFAATATFPVVVKNADPWERRRNPVVPGTTVLREPDELLRLVAASTDRLSTDGLSAVDRAPGIIVQEYLPPEHSRDWIVHLYCDEDSSCPVLFTGMKVRSWPPQAGVTARAYSMPNPELAALAERFCAELGFRGIADLDWRLDLRDGRYKLVDFNPRVGNQFRLFENQAAVDVVRALHLDLTGRPVPRAEQVERKRIIVEHVDVPAHFAYRRLGAGSAQPGPAEPTSTELAWLAGDDPLPVIAMAGHVVVAALAELRRRLRARLAAARRRGWDSRAGPTSGRREAPERQPERQPERHPERQPERRPERANGGVDADADISCAAGRPE
jgi:D-aspartate ligase